MSNTKINIVVVGTNRYFILALRLVHRFSHFYSGNSDINFYFFSDQDPHDYIDDSNLTFIKSPKTNWEKAVLLKFPSMLRAAKDDCDYLVCIDADMDIVKSFSDEDIFFDLFALRHQADHQTNMIECHEQRPESAAYVDITKVNKYYQSGYFGGKKELVIEMINDATRRMLIDQENGIMAVAEDESYLQNFLLDNNAKQIDWALNSYPFVPTKGILPRQEDWGKYVSLDKIWPNTKYKAMLQEVLKYKTRNVLWNIKNNRVVPE